MTILLKRIQQATSNKQQATSNKQQATRWPTSLTLFKHAARIPCCGVTRQQNGHFVSNQIKSKEGMEPEGK
jgi:hypothetical protein